MFAAYVAEVFVSIQGEGTRIGERQVFVRFLGCGLGCRYCDTPAAAAAPDVRGIAEPCRVLRSPDSPEYDACANPVSPHNLSGICSRLAASGIARPVLSLTGGEPLLQSDFLLEWLPHMRSRFTIYLETAGIHYAEMTRLGGLADIVSMDMKLPSSTGLRSWWDEHRRFLEAARDRDVFVKIVVTDGTTAGDVLTAASIIAGQDRRIPLVLQPAGGHLAPPSNRLLQFQEEAMRTIEQVRIIPQVHQRLGLR